MEQFAFHHIGIAVRDLSKAIPIYRALFGYELKSGPFDDAIQNVSACFLSRGEGDVVIELVAPLGQTLPSMARSKRAEAPIMSATRCRM